MPTAASAIRSQNALEPYKTKIVPCPLCGTITSHPEMRTALYKERDHDVDLRPKTYLWTIDYLRWCHPPLYYMWSCPDCGHTAAHNDFQSPGKAHGMSEASFALAMQAHRGDATYQSVRELLQEAAQGAIQRTFVAGFALHLLAIYQIETIPQIVKEEPLTLAQYYLRTAWLFRDMSDTFIEEKATVLNLIKSLEKYWPTVPKNEIACLERSAELFEAALETSSMVATTREEIELILLIARVWMKVGDVRRARNLGYYSRERLTSYETSLEEKEGRKTPEELDEVRQMHLIQSDIFTLLADVQ